MKNKADESTMDAPLVLKRLQADAAKYAKQVDEAEEKLAAVMALGTKLQDKSVIAKLETDVARANDLFTKTAKVLISFDKSIATERKEGEKVSVAEAREIFAQLLLSVGLALEQYAIANCQSFALCDSPEAAYNAHADNWRAAKDGAIASAKNDGKIPNWLI